MPVAICALALGPASAQAVPPNNTSPPTISGGGDPVEGDTLIGTEGTWEGEDLIFAYQWQRSDGLDWDNVGANTDTYTLTSADVGHEIRLEVTASNTEGSDTEVSEPTATVAAAPQPEAPSLGLIVSPRLQAHKRATIRAQGVAVPSLRLWVYEILRGTACPATPSEEKPLTRKVIDGLPVEGDFNEQRRPRMKKPGRHAFCAYLGPDEGTAPNRSFTTRKVRKRLLRHSRAERTVAVALRRHGFAMRVVNNLQESCSRRSRSKLECGFSSSFPGYFLTGAGSVELRRHLSYRFQVSVRGRSFVLTDENEGRLQG